MCILQVEMSMNVLWVCDVVLPEFCDIFGIKKTVIGGWMSGALTELEQYPDINIGLCCPIIDEKRMKDGVFKGYSFYSFKFDTNGQKLDKSLINRFEEIIDEFQPDVVHIWGTEYVHSLAMMLACRNKDIIDRALVYIQGLVSIYARHYLVGLPEKLVLQKKNGYMTLKDEAQEFAMRGKNEIDTIIQAKYIAGRTDWDKACSLEYNSRANFFFMPEILRKIFYVKSQTWDYEKCNKYQIFISQAHYPIKGFHFMIEALELIKRTYSDVKVRIGGNSCVIVDEYENRSPYGEYIYKRINELGLSDNVQFLGKLDEIEMVREYQAANVVVCCSTIENSSNSICEASLIGTPVVASFVGGTHNLVEHDKTGFLYDVNAPYMLAYYVKQIFGDKDKSVNFSQEAYKKVSEIVDPANAGMIIKKTYEKIILDAI